jgi:hypothetical protein
MISGSFESLASVKNLERLSKKQSNNQATDQSGTVDFSFRKIGRITPTSLQFTFGGADGSGLF